MNDAVLLAPDSLAEGRAENRSIGLIKYLSRYARLDELGSGWLVEKGGQDLWRGPPQSGQSPKHQVPLPHDCREHGLAPYENLADLNQLVGKRFAFVGFSLCIRNGTGSPVQAVAVLAE